MTLAVAAAVPTTSAVGCCNGAGDPVIHWSSDGGGPAMPAMPARLPRSKLGTWKPPSSLEQVTAPPTTTPPAFTALPPNQSQPMLVTSNLDPATHHRRRLARASLTTRHLLPFVLGARHSPSNVLSRRVARPTISRPSSARLISANKSRSFLRGPPCDSFGLDMTLGHSQSSASSVLVH